MDGDLLHAEAYQVYVFDCPHCSGQTMLGEDLVDTTPECADCGARVALA